MESRFLTFRPQAAELQPWISYYYIDQRPENVFRAYRCFPHLNSSLSIYKSHTAEGIGKVRYTPGTAPLQIYTPIRQQILEVQQTGPVHRIVVVFPPLGIQQFFKLEDWASYHYSPAFLSPEEVTSLFSCPKPSDLNAALDNLFLKHLHLNTPAAVHKALQTLQEREISIMDLADTLAISRRHLTRLFQTHLGISPKRYRDIWVFRQFLDLKKNKHPEEKLLGLALDLGLTDASHLHKLVKKFTHLAPLPFLENGQVQGTEDIFWHEVPFLHK